MITGKIHYCGGTSEVEVLKENKKTYRVVNRNPKSVENGKPYLTPKDKLILDK